MNIKNIFKNLLKIFKDPIILFESLFAGLAFFAAVSIIFLLFVETKGLLTIIGGLLIITILGRLVVMFLHWLAL